ncbi:ankyrin repeat protein [Apiospora arundinis]
MTRYFTEREVRGALMACNEQSNWDTSALEQLLEQGWDINENYGHPGDALVMAVGPDGLPLVEFLLDHGADPNRNLWGMTHSPLELAAVADVQLGIFSALLNHGAEVQNRSVLLNAASKGRIDMLELILLRAGENAAALVNALPENEEVYENAYTRLDWGTPLHGAAANGQLETVAWLLRQGACPNIKNYLGFTPKEVAAKLGHSECEKLLESAAGNRE